MNTDFHKIRRLPPYVFEQVNRTRASLRAQGADIIDLGMGNPDLPTLSRNLLKRLASRTCTATPHRGAFPVCAVP